MNIISSVKEKLELKFDNISNHPGIILLILGILGLGIRLIFLKWELPFGADNFLYFQYAIDLSIDQKLPTMPEVGNDGWPIFLSPFFSIFHSENFLDYMNLQRLISSTISVITIIPIYLLSKQFVEKKYAIIAVALFVFEPRLIQNSLFGISDPLYILTITFAMYFLINRNEKFTFIAFGLIAFASIIRVEGLLLLPAFSIIYFLTHRKKKNIFQFILLIAIFFIIIAPIAELRTQTIGQDNLTNRIVGNAEIFIKESNNNVNFIIDGLSTTIRFFGLSMLPYFVFFVPFGCLLILKNRKKEHWSLFILSIFIIIPALYAYSREFLDVRYLFPLYPIYCIIGTIGIMYIIKKIKFKKIFVTGIFSSIFILAVLFLVIQDIDLKHEREALSLAFVVSNKTSTIFQYVPESQYINTVDYFNNSKFPDSSSNIKNTIPTLLNLRGINFDSIDEYIQYGRSKGLTHIVIDDSERRPESFKQVFNNEKGYPFLQKEYDSIDNGYEYNLKIFRIDYVIFDGKD